jgi:hypothetical protein
MTRRCNLFLLTAARDLADPWQYLKATVAGIEAQGACVTYRAIICDGVYDGPRFGGWDIISYLGKQPGSGNRDAWFRVFHVAQDVAGDALCLEDDIEIAPGGLQRMLDFDIPGELGFVQFFGSKAYINAKTPPGLRRAPRGTSRFLQATKYTRECLSMLDSFRNRPEYQETPHSADQTIAKACKIQHIDHAIHVPSLVQHVGAVSKNTPTAKLAWWRQADPAAVALGLRETDPTLYR